MDVTLALQVAYATVTKYMKIVCLPDPLHKKYKLVIKKYFV